jgi:hypothetical protein
MKITSILIVPLYLLGLLVGCATLEQRAQKLFDQGKYEEILTTYPTLPIAKRARDKIAERLLAEGKYEEILAKYSDTPSLQEAIDKIAEKMVADTAYMNKSEREGLEIEATNRAAWTLYHSGRIDELIAKYPQTLAGIKARWKRAQAEKYQAK